MRPLASPTFIRLWVTTTGPLPSSNTDLKPVRHWPSSSWTLASIPCALTFASSNFSGAPEFLPEPIGNDLGRSNHDASLLTIQILFGWVSDSQRFESALQASPLGTASD